jgi:hypothetical protein
MEVVGAAGVEGAEAARMDRVADFGLYPIKFLASTTNWYVCPAIKATEVEY